MALITVGQLAQGRLEDLAGLADKSRSIHDSGCVGKGARNADADRTRPTEQRTLVRAAGMALDQNLPFEGVALRGVSADIKQIGIPAEDFAIAEHENA